MNNDYAENSDLSQEFSQRLFWLCWSASYESTHKNQLSITRFLTTSSTNLVDNLHDQFMIHEVNVDE